VTTDRARGAYRALLRIAPEPLRQRHAPEMEALFMRALGEARLEGRIAVVRTWVAAAADIAIARVVRRPGRSRVVKSHEERRPSMFGTDLHYTLRWLWRQKASSALVAAMLALGIGANVVVFSLVNALVLRPFPFPDSDRLVYINETAPKWNLEITGINYPDFHQWTKSAQMFDALALWEEASFNLSSGSEVERISGASVTHDLARVLGLAPLAGRMFTADEDRPKAPRVVVIGEGLWRDRFGGRTDAVGQTLRLGGVPHTIVGVMPRAAEFPGGIRLWVPYAGELIEDSQSYGPSGLGRMKAGVTIDAAQKDLLRAQEPIWQARDRDRNVSPFARSLREQFSRDYRTAALGLLVAVALLLAVTCANVASIMLARALARRREMGIRLAVGASRLRLARQLFLENLLLALVGGAAGLALGRWALRVLIAAAGDQVPPWASFELDARVLAFSLAVSLTTALLFGLAPALHAMRSSVRSAMIDTGAGSTASPGGRRTLGWLVAAEFALATILLVCGGLLFRAYDRVRQIDPGFSPENVVSFSVALPESTYPDEAKRLAFWDRLTATFARLPGVEAAGVISCPPLGCHWGTFFRIEGRAPLAPGEPNPVVLHRPASEDYFRVMGIRLKTGRFFKPGDGRNDNHVVIVNETFVRTFWPGVKDPVGRRIRGTSNDSPWVHVVGMVEDVRHYGLERPMRPGIYLPLASNPARALSVVLRSTGGNPAALMPPARAALRELDPELPIYRTRTMEEMLSRSLAQRVLYSWLLAVFATLSLILALGGTYGVTSYLVSQRTREIGIRVALGASSADVTRGVLRRSLAVAGSGLVLGIAGSLGAARLLSGLLFGVPPHDVSVLGAASLVLLCAAVLVNWAPARRAARIDPMRSLRAE
jgi:predicted permease